MRLHATPHFAYKKWMPRNRLLYALLVALVSLPGFTVGHLLRQGEQLLALEVGLVTVIVVLLAGALAQQSRLD
jgi:hypothetical protein